MGTLKVNSAMKICFPGRKLANNIFKNNYYA